MKIKFIKSELILYKSIYIFNSCSGYESKEKIKNTRIINVYHFIHRERLTSIIASGWSSLTENSIREDQVDCGLQWNWKLGIALAICSSCSAPRRPQTLHTEFNHSSFLTCEPVQTHIPIGTSNLFELHKLYLTEKSLF